MAVAYAVSQVAMLLPSFHYASRGTSVTTWDIVAAMRRPGDLSAVAAASAFWARMLLDDVSPVVLLLGLPVIALLSWGSLLLVWPRARQEVMSTIGVLVHRRGETRDGDRGAVALKRATAAGKEPGG